MPHLSGRAARASLRKVHLGWARGEQESAGEEAEKAAVGCDRLCKGPEAGEGRHHRGSETSPPRLRKLAGERSRAVQPGERWDAETQEGFSAGE